MGKPVDWSYVVRIEPAGNDWAVTLRRVQQGTDTSFLWLQTTIRRDGVRASQDVILQALYTAVVALMELTV